MKISSEKTGFTLIELLVVIAIIGVLATVVLASLGTTRTRSQDTAVKTNLNQMRAQAQLFYETNNGSYGTSAGACSGVSGSLFVVPTIASQISAAVSQGAGAASCQSTASSWAVSVPLKSNSANSWCVDWTNASKQITGALSAGQYTCP